MSLVTSETQKPDPTGFGDTFERGLDPWHNDALKGTPGYGVIGTDGPRKSGWHICDSWGNQIGFVPDGTPVKGDST